MARVFGRNVNVNFNYCTKAVIFFMSRIIVNKLSVLHKILFRKLEKNLKCFIKLHGDIKFFINYIYYNMRVTPQHKVIGPYNLDRIIHFIKKIMQRVKIEETVKRKHACSLKIKICVISCVKH